MTVGELLAFYALVGQLYAADRPARRQFQATAVATQVSVERLYEIFDEPEPVRDRPGAAADRSAREGARVSAMSRSPMARVDRSGAPANVLDGVNLRIEPGMRVGVLGPSGAGKSTLLALAPRLYDIPEGPTSDGSRLGLVCFDGVDVRDWKLADLRRPWPWCPSRRSSSRGRSAPTCSTPTRTRPRTRCGRPWRSPTSPRRSMRCREGLDTPVGERAYSLSGGQRQRLALARAIVAEPAVLLLDDCTSALDAETEARIQRALDRHLPGRTCVIVSHKVASVRRCDLIVVLDDGQIVEQGTHGELIGRQGYYADTFTQQTRALELAKARE